MMRKKLRPVVRYHGGKNMLADWIVANLPEHKIYVEPFGGAGSVLMRKPRSFGEVYNDLDDDIVNLFRVLRNVKQSTELERQIRLTPYARNEFEQSYTHSKCEIDRARKTIIRAFLGFGSDSATKRTGFRAKCFGSHRSACADWTSYPDYISLFTERLQGVVIENKPAIDVILQQDADGVVFYVDPPYVLSTRKTNGAYRFEMNDDDHLELLQVLKNVSGSVVISGYESDLYSDTLVGWSKIRRSTKADFAQDRTEILYVSPGSNTQYTLLDAV